MNEVKYKQYFKSFIDKSKIENKNRKLKRQLQEMTSSLKKMKQSAKNKQKSLKIDKMKIFFDNLSKEMKIDYYYVFAFKVYIRALIQDNKVIRYGRINGHH